MVIRRLNETEIINSFNCGDSDLDDFVNNEAILYQESFLSVNYVMERKEETIAFFSLSNDKISVNEFDNKTSFNRFRSRKFVNRKRIKSYPAVKIGRFAIGLSSQGKGLGTTLLDFIKAYFLIDNKSGCRFITVDAYKSAIPFYEKNGFVPLQDNDGNITQLMYFDLADYRKCFLG